MALLHNVGLQESADNVATMVRLSIDGTGCLASEDCGGNVVSGDSLHHHHLAVRSVMAIFRNVFAGDLKALTAKFQRLYSVNCIAGEIDKAGVTAVQSMFERMLFRDTDRSRQFEFHIRLCPPCDAYQPQCYIGLFSSAPVSLVSKPAKKKSQQRLTDSLNTRASEDLVCSGQTVAFFNRIRGQNVATRFLGLSDLADTLAPLVVKSMDWDAFIIELSGVSTPASTTSSVGWL